MAKVRSPNYPALDLGAALVQARKAFDKDNRNKMSRAVLGKHMGHENLSGPALTKIAALKTYGIVEGVGDELRISDDGVSAMMAPEGSVERKDALERLALQPALFGEIRKTFASPPSEDNLRYWLIKRQYSGDAATKAAKSYLATMRLASGLTAPSDSSSSEEIDEADEAEIEVGDLVQVEIGGAFQLPKPARVRALQEHEGQRWVFVDTSETGIPLEQIVLQQKGDGDPKGQSAPPRLQLEKPSSPGKMERAEFPLQEGIATVELPRSLSEESYQDLVEWLRVVLRKTRRIATMGRIPESALIFPTLQCLYEAGGKLNTTDLIQRLEDWLQPEGEDLKILDGRSDTKFSQKVRNLKSHKTLEKAGYAIEIDDGFQLTDAGKALVEATRL